MEFQLESDVNLSTQSDQHQVKFLVPIVPHVLQTANSVLIQPSLHHPHLPHSKALPWSRQQKRKEEPQHTTTKCPSGQNVSHENFFILSLILFESSRNSMGFLSLIAFASNDKFFSRSHYNLIKKNMSWTYLVIRLFLSTNRNHHTFHSFSFWHLSNCCQTTF